MGSAGSSALQRARRQGFALAIYRSLLCLALLVVSFTAFPDKIAPVALAVLVFSQGINAVGMAVGLIALAQNELDDAAERKTRHTIILAQEHDGGEVGPQFWLEVDRRVAEERGARDDARSWSANVGSIALRVLGYAAADIFLVVVALLIAG